MKCALNGKEDSKGVPEQRVLTSQTAEIVNAQKKKGFVMSQQLTLAELITAAIEAENTLRKIYIGFTYKFALEQEVSDFWQAMADDEATHAQILTKLRDQVFKGSLDLPVEVCLVRRAAALKDIDVKGLVNSVHNLNDAYEIAFKLESSEVNVFFSLLTIRYMPVEESYDIITATIDRHLLRLAQFGRTFGNAEQCRQVAATA